MISTSFLPPSVHRVAVLALVSGAAWLGCVSEDPPAAPAICPRYCDEEEAKCKDINYTNRDQCLAACALMKPGNEGEADDTAGCRLTQAKNAVQGDPVSCKKASAYGGGACGDPCATFCRMVDVICISGDDAPATKPYTSESSCIEACRSTPLVYDKNGSEGQQQPFDGADTLNCRMFHLLLALDDRAGHCPHTQTTSATCKTR